MHRDSGSRWRCRVVVGVLFEGMVAKGRDVVSAREWTTQGKGLDGEAVGGMRSRTYNTCWYKIEVRVAGRDVAGCSLRAIGSRSCRAGPGPQVGKVGNTGGCLRNCGRQI